MKTTDLRPARAAFADYLNRPVCIGGEVTTRGAFIHEMRAAGHPQILIDRFLQGLDRAERVAGVAQP